ncbi:hypothetical protein N9355_03400 [Crocinitomicaceae bacterium]|nr:hypothetical protein [Crocinitomicaceae bacterium]
MKTVLLFLSVICLIPISLGQNTGSQKTVIIHGMVKELNTMTPIPHAKVTVLRENTTVKVTEADSEGIYAISVDVVDGEQLEIQGKAKHHSNSRNLLIIESTASEDYLLNIELVYQTVSNAPPRVFFDADHVKHLPFDLTMYCELVEDNPKICLEIELYSRPEESEKLTKKRLVQFEKFLISNEFPMNQIDFNFTHHTKKCSEEESCLAELFFEISSVEGHCLQE